MTAEATDRITREDLSRIESISLTRLLKGLPIYFKTARTIGRHPLSYPLLLDFRDPMLFTHSLEFATYGIMISFFLLTPIFMFHSKDLSKVTFLVRMLCQLTMYGFLLHIALKILGERGASLKKTLTTYAFIGGIGAPVSILLYYPLFIEFGPVAIFGTGQDAFELGMSLPERPWLFYYLNIVNVLIAIWAYITFLSWFSKSHCIKKRRVFLAFIMCGIIGVSIQLFILHPLFNIVFVWVDKVLNYI